MLNQFHSLLAQSSAKGSRSTALQPAHWLLGIVISAELSAIGIAAPPTVVQMLGILCIIAFGIEAFAFLFLLFRDRDALRSERFAIAKLSIEKGLIGDSTSGFKGVSAATDGAVIDVEQRK